MRAAFDANLLFDDAIAGTTLTVAGSPVTSTNSIDLGAADIDEVNAGEVVVKFPSNASAGAATLSILIQDSADDAAFATVLTSEAFAKGTPLEDIRIPLPTKSLRRYGRLQYVVTTADFNAGNLTAGLLK